MIEPWDADEPTAEEDALLAQADLGPPLDAEDVTSERVAVERLLAEEGLTP